MTIDRSSEIEERIENEIIVDCYDSEEAAMGWFNYMDEQLGFPFAATCCKELQVSPLKKGEEVTVTGIGDADYCTSTILVQIKWQGRSMSVPLSQLEADVEEEDEDTLQAISDWEYWVESGRVF